MKMSDVREISTKLKEMMETIEAVKGEDYAEFIMHNVEGVLFLNFIQNMNCMAGIPMAKYMANHLIEKSLGYWVQSKKLSDADVKKWTTDGNAEKDIKALVDLSVPRGMKR